MLTCSKTYRDVPLSHRQPRHPGRCSRIHGHSWAITLTFAADEPDEHGFVVDFGELHYLADWIDENLDHATVAASDDPRLDELQPVSSSSTSSTTPPAKASPVRSRADPPCCEREHPIPHTNPNRVVRVAIFRLPWQQA